MRTLQRPFVRHAAVLGAGALLATAGCVSRESPATEAQIVPGAATMSLACEPSQRAVVHPAVVNGIAMSQVECVTVGGAPATVGVERAQVVTYVPQPAASPVAVYQPAAVASDPRVVPATYTVPAPESRRVESESVQRYERRPATRSVKKSAIIIGSSAGAGAGLGAVIGGKKGAAIGALLGGGGATLWDQITRHKDR